MNAKLIRFLRENRGFIAFVVLMTCFRSALADWNSVPTGSMKPTIIEGDRVLVNKMAYDLRVPFTGISLQHYADPERGDIITFESEHADMRLIKRVVGVPGDTVSMINNHLIINGEMQKYTFLSKDEHGYLIEEQLGDVSHRIRVDEKPSRYSNFGPVDIPAGHYLVLGDNRDNSADSRVHGLVPMSEIRGRANQVVISLDYDNYYLPRSERFFDDL